MWFSMFLAARRDIFIELLGTHVFEVTVGVFCHMHSREEQSVDDRAAQLVTIS